MSQVADNLVPGEIYLLKFSRVSAKNEITYMVVLECEFIKYNDDQYSQEYMDFANDEDEDAVPTGNLIGNIYQYDEHGTYDVIPREFDDPLYPYSRYLFFGKAGLFKLLKFREDLTIFKKVKSKVRGNNEYNNTAFSLAGSGSAYKNTENLINGQTLIWADLDKVKIRPMLDKTGMFHSNALDAWGINETIGDDTIHHIKRFLKKENKTKHTNTRGGSRKSKKRHTKKNNKRH